LRTHLSWHGARVTFLALFLIALVRVRTVNFVELAQSFMGTAKAESSEKRLHCFFSEFDINYSDIAPLVARLMEIPQPWVLSVDRTNWEFGDCVFNILMLRVVHLMARIPSIPRWSLATLKLENSKYSNADGGCVVIGCR
jgi:hypothetical protein